MSSWMFDLHYISYGTGLKPKIISKESLLSLLSAGLSDYEFINCSMLPDGSCYAPTSHQNQYFFLFPHRQAYIKHFLGYYFSRDNLNYDNYLTQKMDQFGFVSIRVLLDFPRLSILSVSLEELIEAIMNHPLLELMSIQPDMYPLVARRDRYPIVHYLKNANFFTTHPPPDFYLQQNIITNKKKNKPTTTNFPMQTFSMPNFYNSYQHKQQQPQLIFGFPYHIIPNNIKNTNCNYLMATIPTDYRCNNQKSFHSNYKNNNNNTSRECRINNYNSNRKRFTNNNTTNNNKKNPDKQMNPSPSLQDINNKNTSGRSSSRTSSGIGSEVSMNHSANVLN